MDPEKLAVSTWSLHTGWDAEAALRTVKDTGYTGPISIEYGGGGPDEWTNVLRTKQIVDRIFT